MMELYIAKPYVSSIHLLWHVEKLIPMMLVRLMEKVKRLYKHLRPELQPPVENLKSGLYWRVCNLYYHQPIYYKLHYSFG